MPIASAPSSAARAREAASLLALAGWSALLDRVLAGVCHDLNGRVSSLIAVTQLLEMEEPVGKTLAQEPERLERVAQFLASIPADLGAEPVPASPPEVLDRAVAIQAKIGGLEIDRPSITAGDHVPPILVNEGRALRGLAILARMSVDANEEDEDRPLRIFGDPKEAVLVFPWDGRSGDPDTTLEPLERLFAMDGGGLSVEAAELVVRFPSLAVARAGIRSAR